jgi:hypothetical protein
MVTSASCLTDRSIDSDVTRLSNAMLATSGAMEKVREIKPLLNTRLPLLSWYKVDLASSPLINQSFLMATSSLWKMGNLSWGLCAHSIIGVIKTRKSQVIENALNQDFL